jgi:hypothetical protein
MKSFEDKIWDTITNSAKKRFDYSSFENDFPTGDIADSVLFKVIAGLAAKWPKDKIAVSLFNDFLILGLKTDKGEWAKFIDKNEGSFKLEILASQIAREMLDNGSDPIAVHGSICQLLE